MGVGGLWWPVVGLLAVVVVVRAELVEVTGSVGKVEGERVDFIADLWG